MSDIFLIRVRVQHIKHHDEKKDFVIAAVSIVNGPVLLSQKKLTTCVGLPGTAQLGATFDVLAEESTHEKFGHQLKVKSAYIAPEASRESMLTFLCSHKLFPRKTSVEILNKFGSIQKLMSVIRDKPEALTVVEGVTEQIARRLSRKFCENESQICVIQFALARNIDIKIAKKIVGTLGPYAEKAISANPYCLADIPGITFPVADNIAMHSFGVSRDSPLRITALVKYLVELEVRDNGSSYTTVELISGNSAPEKLRTILVESGVTSSQIINGLLVIPREDVVRDNEKLYPTRIYTAEHTIAVKLAQMLARPM